MNFGLQTPENEAS